LVQLLRLLNALGGSYSSGLRDDAHDGGVVVLTVDEVR
jgi:hypothetical protein